MLSFFVDDEGIIWVGGCVDKVIVFYEIKYLVLLFYDYIVLCFIIEEVYWCGYFGVVIIVVKMRINYWIVWGYDFVKVVKYKCVFCREMELKIEM